MILPLVLISSHSALFTQGEGNKQKQVITTEKKDLKIVMIRKNSIINPLDAKELTLK